MPHSICEYSRGCQVKLCDPSLTRAIPERFRDEYRTHYKALYKCPVYFTCLLQRRKHCVHSMVSLFTSQPSLPIVVVQPGQHCGPVSEGRSTPGCGTAPQTPMVRWTASRGRCRCGPTGFSLPRKWMTTMRASSWQCCCWNHAPASGRRSAGTPADQSHPTWY